MVVPTHGGSRSFPTQRWAGPHRRGASVHGERRVRRSTVRARNEMDGMIYSLVFEGSLQKLSTRQLKRHLEDTTGVPAKTQVLIVSGEVLHEDSCIAKCAVNGEVSVTLRARGSIFEQDDLSTTLNASSPAARPAPPKPGMQPPQLPPVGAAFPSHALHPTPQDGAIDPPSHSEWDPPFLPDRTMRNFELHVHPHDDTSRKNDPRRYSDTRRSSLSSKASPPDSGTRQPSAGGSSGIARRIKENTECLRSLERVEESLRVKEMQLAEEEQKFRLKQRQVEAEEQRLLEPCDSPTRLTTEQLDQHNTLTRMMHQEGGDETQFVCVEELPPARATPPPSMQRSATSTARRLLKRRSSVPRSATLTQQGGDRDLEIESAFRQACARFDAQRSMNAFQMDNLQAQLIERRAELEKEASVVQQELEYVRKKRQMVDTLKHRQASYSAEVPSPQPLLRSPMP
ncbi:hypothetical protein DIPPA_22925 [Diplonema papillatum]|nr:hypothetical protein DIPPA_22925 [Diplonema papillatum]